MALGTGPHPSPRYEIRPLRPEHISWAAALYTHANVFHSPLFAAIYPENKAARAYRTFISVEPLIRHQVQSGLSIGVFDTKYKFKQVDSAAAGGKLCWDLFDETATADQLLEQMDFPLVSISLAYDSFRPPRLDQIQALMGCLPVFPTAYAALAEKDLRDPKTWKATGPGQVMFRNGTATRKDLEGKTFMKGMAYYMMQKAASEGFRGIQIECFHDAVTHVWRSPPPSFRAEVVSEVDSRTWVERNANGEKRYPFYPSKQRLTKIYVRLR